MIRDLHRVLDLVESGFQRHRVLVVGDLMLDQYLWGDVSRISPEAPVPVLRSAHRTSVAGGAANVAMNLVGLGTQVSLAGFWARMKLRRHCAGCWMARESGRMQSASGNGRQFQRLA